MESPLLDSLSGPPRPPTPPKASVPFDDDVEKSLDDTVNFLESAFEVEPAPHATPKRPRSESLHVPSSAALPSSQRLKRVSFAPLGDWGVHTPLDAASQQSISLSPSALLSSPSKSILKPFKSTPSSLSTQVQPAREARPAYSFDNLAAILDYEAKSLESGSVKGREDAYMSILTTMKSYERIPQAESLKESIDSLLDSSLRDIQLTVEGTGAPAMPIVSYAIKVLVCLIRVPDIRPMLDTSQCSRLLDHILEKLADNDISKTMVYSFLELLALQTFSPSVWTSTRAQRLSNILYKIDRRVPAQGLHIRRIRVYRKMVEQIPSHMTPTFAKWFGILLEYMLRNDRTDTARASFECALRAGETFGTNKKAIRDVNLMLEDPEDGVTLGETLMQRMSANLKLEDKRLIAPQLWAVLIYFLKGSDSGSWMQRNKNLLFPIISECFDHPDRMVKRQTFQAWNRFIFVTKPDLSTPQFIRSSLRIPFPSEFFKQSGPEGSNWEADDTSMVLGSYTYLLYYALRPTASFEQLDFYWQHYVANIVAVWEPGGDQHLDNICTILACLFRSSSDWTDSPALVDSAMPPGALAQLSPKFIRSRFAKIIHTVGTVAPHGSRKKVNEMWRCLMEALQDASSKEITPSAELRSAMAEITRLMHRLYLSAEKKPRMFSRFISFLALGVNSLHHSIWLEKFLADGLDTTPVASTPSRSKSMLSPASFLLGLFAGKLGRGFSRESHDFEKWKHLVRVFLPERLTKTAKLVFLADLSDVTTREFSKVDGKLPGATPVAESILRRIVELFQDKENVGTISQNYELVQHIIGGLFPYLPEDTDLGYGSLLQLAKSEIGEAGAFLTITEPFAELLERYFKTNGAARSIRLKLAQLVIEGDDRPRIKSIRLAHTQLWGTAPSKNDPYAAVYSLINTCLRFVSKGLAPEQLKLSKDEAIAFVQIVSRYLRRDYPSPEIVLQHIQDGIVSMLDMQNLIFLGGDRSGERLFTEISKLWHYILVIIRESPIDSSTLRTFSILLGAGFSCRHRHIRGPLAALWNETFGVQSTLQYPEELIEAFIKAKEEIQLFLPAFPVPAIPELNERGQHHEAENCEANLLNEMGLQSSPPIECAANTSLSTERHSAPNSFVERLRSDGIQAVDSDPISSDVASLPSSPSRGTSNRSDAQASAHWDEEVRANTDQSGQPNYEDTELPSSPPRMVDDGVVQAQAQPDDADVDTAQDIGQIQDWDPMQDVEYHHPNDNDEGLAVAANGDIGQDVVPQESPPEFVSQQLISEMQENHPLVQDSAAENGAPSSFPNRQQPSLEDHFFATESTNVVECSFLERSVCAEEANPSAIHSVDILAKEKPRNAKKKAAATVNSASPLKAVSPKNINSPKKTVTSATPPSWSSSPMKNLLDGDKADLRENIRVEMPDERASRKNTSAGIADRLKSVFEETLKKEPKVLPAEEPVKPEEPDDTQASPSTTEMKGKKRFSSASHEDFVPDSAVEKEPQLERSKSTSIDNIAHRRSSRLHNIPIVDKPLSRPDDLLWRGRKGRKSHTPARTRPAGPADEHATASKQLDISDAPAVASTNKDDKEDTPDRPSRHLDVKIKKAKKSVLREKRKADFADNVATPADSVESPQTKEHARKKRRVLYAESVTIPSSLSFERVEEAQADIVVEASTPSDSQAQTPAEESGPSAANVMRRILHPRSIITRLKGILTDCQQMVFGTQEQREIDDLLFDMKKEVLRNGKDDA
ncbi:hypothetical protein EJ06DRAFT_583400 [Trichodelitschia bisporula]|uniref:Telomere-associated protein Rif1 N-terminal domain-containing protein n=1 Tax=Trichodelitschia bisporula TaxID=703511 RepID=A0A6G1HS67_9PEZI|nr:hypothetical protein EJ06DRAFT_583400 [Trichodelitschia bisporula]